MDVNFYSRLRSGRMHTMGDQPCDVADRIFNAHKDLVSIPWTAHYRVTISDPLAGDRIIRDSDLEWLKR
jgi:hypothetical protein